MTALKPPLNCDQLIRTLRLMAISRVRSWQLYPQMDMSDCVDPLQDFAERTGLVKQIGPDLVQEILDEIFAPVRAAGRLIDPDEYVRASMRWEMADPRDRWKWTGEAPPPEAVRNGPLKPERPCKPEYRPAQSTVDAFWHVVRNESAEYLRDWLAQHPLDAPELLKIWKGRKCSATAK